MPILLCVPSFINLQHIPYHFCLGAKRLQHIKLLIFKVYLFRSTILIILCTLLCVSFVLWLKSEHKLKTYTNILYAHTHTCMMHTRACTARTSTHPVPTPTHTYTQTHTHRGMHVPTGLYYWFESTLPHQNMKRYVPLF